MLTALVVSAVFLASYLYYHFVVKQRPADALRRAGPDAAGWVRTCTTRILLTHTVLAVVVAPLALVTAYLGLRGRLARHVRAGPLDAADLAVRVGDRRGGLLDAVPALSRRRDAAATMTQRRRRDGMRRFARSCWLWCCSPVLACSATPRARLRLPAPERGGVAESSGAEEDDQHARGRGLQPQHLPDGRRCRICLLGAGRLPGLPAV